MSATTSDRDTKYVPMHDVGAIPVAAATKLPAGTLICIDASGNAVAAADTSGYEFAGVPDAQADNTNGLAGAITVRCRRSGAFLLAKSGTFAVANIGDEVYVADNQTVTLTAGNGVKVGRYCGAGPNSQVWIDITGYARGGIPQPA